MAYQAERALAPCPAAVVVPPVRAAFVIAEAFLFLTVMLFKRVSTVSAHIMIAAGIVSDIYMFPAAKRFDRVLR
jgi:hypothetical protein